MSGLMHELMLWYMSGVVSGRQFAFFSVQAPIMILERTLGSWLGGVWERIYERYSRQSEKQGSANRLVVVVAKFGFRVVQPVITFGVLIMLAGWWFFPCFTDVGLEQKGMNEIRGMIERLQTALLYCASLDRTGSWLDHWLGFRLGQ